MIRFQLIWQVKQELFKKLFKTSIKFLTLSMVFLEKLIQ